MLRRAVRRDEKKDFDVDECFHMETVKKEEDAVDKDYVGHKGNETKVSISGNEETPLGEQSPKTPQDRARRNL